MATYLLESHLVVLYCIFGYPRFYLFSFGVVAQKTLFAQIRRNTPHSEENATVLLLSLNNLAFSGGRNGFGRVVAVNSIRTRIRSVPGKRFDVF